MSWIWLILSIVTGALAAGIIELVIPAFLPFANKPEIPPEEQVHLMKSGNMIGAGLAVWALLFSPFSLRRNSGNREGRSPQMPSRMRKPLTTSIGLLVLLNSPVRFESLGASAGGEAGLGIQMYAGLNISGTVGRTYTIQYVSDLRRTNESDWQTLASVQLTSSNYFWLDPTPAASGKRFYRAVATPRTNAMVLVPAGTFTMGSPATDPDRDDDEGPQTEVTISRSFYIGKFLVTQGDYLAVVGRNPSYFSASNGFGLDLTLPVETVTRTDAINYCVKLTGIERQEGTIPSDWAYRLPTEAEWEYACRAGSSTRFYYGDDIGYTQLRDYAWYAVNSGFRAQPVGQKPPNAWGLRDMIGGMREWCQGWYGNYPGGNVTDPQGPLTGDWFVLRGGSWISSARSCRSASRALVGTAVKGEDIGFRVVLAPAGQ